MESEKLSLKRKWQEDTEEEEGSQEEVLNEEDWEDDEEDEDSWAEKCEELAECCAQKVLEALRSNTLTTPSVVPQYQPCTRPVQGPFTTFSTVSPKAQQSTNESDQKYS